MPSTDVVFVLTGDVRRNSRALKQLRVLAAGGWHVTAVTTGPPAAGPLGPGIDLEVLPAPPGGGPRFFARWDRRLRALLRRLPARAYHASDLYVLPACAAAARREDAALVYDARECYPHVAATAGRPWVRRFWQAVEHRYARRADAVFTVSERIASYLEETHGLPRPAVLYNVPPYQAAPASDRLRRHLGLGDNDVIVLHQGQMRADRGCTLLVDAMRDVPTGTLVFMGDGPLRPALERQAAPLGDRVRFVDAVPPDDLLATTASADVGVTLLEDTCLNHRYALPNKLFEYLMAGLPVLASDLPEIRGVVATYNVGRVVNPMDRPALVAALRQMTSDADARARWAANAPAVFDVINWETAAGRLHARYRALLGS